MKKKACPQSSTRVNPATLLPKQRKKSFFECLLSIKVRSGFSSNIKGTINMTKKKFQNLKSHDCHVIMTQLLPVALRGLLPENVRLAIVKLFKGSLHRKQKFSYGCNCQDHI